MEDRDDNQPMTLAGMPGILVVVTLFLLSVVHLANLWGDRGAVRWSGPGLERHFQEAGAEHVREPATRLRATLGLRANDVVPRDEELYYLPDIAHVTGRSFLAPRAKNSHVVLTRANPNARAADPLAAIVRFDRDLRERGVRLVLMPTPSKPMFAAPGGDPVRNAGFGEFLAAMRRQGIPVFDPAPLVADYQRRGHRLFLRTDSHWTPEAMRLCAIFLAAFLEREGLLDGPSGEELRGATLTVTNSGDLARLLGIESRAAGQETIDIHPVTYLADRRAEGQPWEPDPASPLLLLGDSFTNVFSLSEMDWGRDAGLAEALSQCVSFRIDRIARNADGAFASRQELARNPSRLAGKKVVVWQFAARELSFGDWQVLPMSPAPPSMSSKAESAGAIVLEGTVARAAPVPSLTRTPYRQAVMEVLLTDVTSPDAEVPEQVVVLGLGIDDRKPTAMTKWRPGEKLTLEVRPWRKVEERYGRLQRFALEDPEFELIDAQRFWAKPD